jgi:hypothetical protein
MLQELMICRDVSQTLPVRPARLFFPTSPGSN